MDLKNKYEKEAYVDLKEICWRLLEQWKAIVIVALCVMALFLGFVYLHNANAAKKEDQTNQTKQKVTEEEVLNSLPESERSIVASAYRLLQKREQLSNYVCTAPILQVDPNHIKRLHVSWAVDDNGENMNSVIMAYLMAFQEESRINALLKASGTDLSHEQFANLMNVSFPTQLNLDIVSIYIILTDDMNVEAIQEELKSQVESIHTRLQNEFGDHRIVNYQSEVSVVADANLYQSQITALSGLVTVNTQLNNLKNTFSAEQEKAFSKLQSLGNKQVVTEQTQTAPKSLSLMNIIIGLILGACAYVVVYFLIVVISNRTISSSILQGSSVRLLGEWYGPSGERILTRDRFVWGKHHRKHLDQETEISKIADTIESICSFKQIKTLLLMLSAECTQEQEAFIQNLSERIEAQGIDTNLIKSDQSEASFSDRDLIAADGVVLMIIDSNTKSKTVDDIIDRCNDYEKPLVGSVYLG